MMRNRLRCALVLMSCVFVLSLTVAADGLYLDHSYTIADTDITITLPLPQWVGFSRDKVREDESLAQYGLTTDAMEATHMYFYALTYYDENDSMVLTVYFHTSDASDTSDHLSYFRDAEILKMTEDYALSVGAEDYGIYRNDYAFMRLNKLVPEDAADEAKSRILYYTIVNGNLYSLVFESRYFNEQKIADIEAVLDGITFRVNPSAYTRFCFDEFQTFWMPSLISMAVVVILAYVVIGWDVKREQKRRLMYEETLRAVYEYEISHGIGVESEDASAVSDGSEESEPFYDDGYADGTEDEYNTYDDPDEYLGYEPSVRFTVLQYTAIFLIGVQLAKLLISIFSDGDLQLIGPAGVLSNVIAVTGFFLPAITAVMILIIYCIKRYKNAQIFEMVV